MRALSLAILCSCGSTAQPDVPTTSLDPAALHEVMVTGDNGSTLGIFDASLFYPAGASVGYLTYSSVPSQSAVHTRLATSTDGGGTWTFASDVNDTTAATVAFSAADPGCPGASGNQSGHVIHEVSSLVVDGGRFLVFAHSYFILDGTPPTLCRDVGSIDLYSATETAGPWTETPLLGWPSPTAFASRGARVAGLEDCVVLTEPGARLRPDGALDLVVTCAYPKNGAPAFRQELLRSTDHAATFTRVATLLDANENAGDLFHAGTEDFLIVSPGGQVHMPGGSAFAGYAGCDVYSLGGALRRRIAAKDGVFSGACTYADGAQSLGYVIGILGAAPRVFRLYATGVQAP